MIVVIARYRTLPGTGDEVAAILARHVGPTRAEPGCLTFTANRSADDPDRFALYERYVDEDAFQAHRRTPHFRMFIEQGVVPLLEERVWERYEEIEPAET